GTPVRLVSVRYPLAKAVHKIDAALTPNQPLARDFSAMVPVGTPVTQPYWLREEGSAGLFRVDETKLIGQPVNPPAFLVEFVFEIEGQTFVVADEPVQVVVGAPAAQQRRAL